MISDFFAVCMLEIQFLSCLTLDAIFGIRVQAELSTQYDYL